MIKILCEAMAEPGTLAGLCTVCIGVGIAVNKGYGAAQGRWGRNGNGKPGRGYGERLARLEERSEHIDRRLGNIEGMLTVALQKRK